MIGLGMRTLWHYALAVLIAVLITFATGEGRRAVAAPPEQAKCCAFVKMGAPVADCGHQAPNSNEAQQCCSSCALCLAVLIVADSLFVYPPSGEEHFPAALVADHFRSDQPPVPPPRRLAA